MPLGIHFLRPACAVRVVVGFFVLVVGLAPAALAQDDPTEPVRMDTLEVIDVTPVGGVGVPIARIPTNVQSVSADEVGRIRPIDVTDALASRLGSVHLSNLGSNPFQPDVNYRGFRGSPLLGLPQGLSVFLDGARVNETFGDIVNWDLIPQVAIGRMDVLPGSNPAFGLNTLGGALSVHTKSGFSAPGLRLQSYGGSHARLAGQAEYGGHRGSVGYYAAMEGFQEDGWRDFSDSETQKGFAKVTYAGARTTLEASGLVASSRLRGNGAVPVELLQQNRSAVFTFPDQTDNTMGLVNLSGSHRVSASVRLQGTAYARFTQTDTFNGDDSDYGACPLDVPVVGFATPGDALCFGVEEEEGEAEEEEPEAEPRQVFDTAGTPVAATDDVDSATQNTSDTDQRRFGVSLETAWTSTLWGGDNRLVVGVNGETGGADFFSQTELGRLTDQRGTVGSGILDAESLTSVETDAYSASAYVVNTYTPISPLTVTLSGRFNHARVTLDDQLGTALNGDHSFDRFNPALGVTYRIGASASVFANVSSSNRAPTPVELTCADPDDPCRLPNGFQADPPLEQVVATTVSGGVRGGAERLQGAVSVFRTDARDDIYFISAGPARNSGFFDNIGDTRRQGVEFMGEAQVGRVDAFASYTWLDATFRSDFLVNAPNHPLADDGEIQVESGDRLPLTPRHLGKLGLTVEVVPRVSVGTNVVVQGRQYIRGDESNQLDRLDAFALWNLTATARLFDGLAVFGKVDNLFDTAYETAGLLGEPDEVEAFEDFENPRFVTPGPPRMIRIGLGYEF